MRIRRVAGLTGVQIGFATILGVLGGFYIWRPEFDKRQKLGVTMDKFKGWNQKIAASPNLLPFAFFGLSLSAVGMYTMYYKPWIKRKQLLIAQQYADRIYELENRPDKFD